MRDRGADRVRRRADRALLGHWWQTLHQNGTVFNPKLDVDDPRARWRSRSCSRSFAFTLLYAYLVLARLRARASSKKGTKSASSSARSHERVARRAGGAGMIDRQRGATSPPGTRIDRGRARRLRRVAARAGAQLAQRSPVTGWLTRSTVGTAVAARSDRTGCATRSSRLLCIGAVVVDARAHAEERRVLQDRSRRRSPTARQRRHRDRAHRRRGRAGQRSTQRTTARDFELDRGRRDRAGRFTAAAEPDAVQGLRAGRRRGPLGPATTFDSDQLLIKHGNDYKPPTDARRSAARRIRSRTQ